ncbi:MAG: UDP-2,3-diacylglucosamine diphosphatase LpxI [Thermodesulfovibrionales bacterium]|nr:UDP-2,3-diacylglucosamine diphosphatase LpxI [Thermodesulfovibrionales bacterium]
MQTIGILAGSGNLPIIIVKDAINNGYKVTVVAIENLADKKIEDIAHKTFWLNVGRLGKLIKILKNEGINKIILAGKVPKSLLYKSPITPDLRAIKLLFKMKTKSDDVMLKAFAEELLNEGIEIIDTTTFSPHILTPEGLINSIPPTDEQIKDIAFGWQIAKEIGRLDIGQTVVVKGLSVMAVEAIEGTDEAIIRGGSLAGNGAVVVKVSKPQQDMRLDVPAVGLNTIQSMIKAKAKVLAIESGRSIIFDREEFISLADANKISILGYKG